jgi:hypothetical protein
MSVVIDEYSSYNVTDISHIGILATVGINVIFMYHAILKQYFKNYNKRIDDKLYSVFYKIPFHGWNIIHMMCQVLIYTLFHKYPKYILLTHIIQVVWELYEYILHHWKKNPWWVHDYKDIIFNIMGTIVGYTWHKIFGFNVMTLANLTKIFFWSLFVILTSYVRINKWSSVKYWIPVCIGFVAFNYIVNYQLSKN